MSEDIKVQLVVGDKVVTLDDDALARVLACRVKRSFGGTEYKDPEYGSVEVEIGAGDKAKTYTVIVGNWEWIQAEKELGVKGVVKITAEINGSEEAATKFYKIALSRHHKDLKLEEVARLRDWRVDGRPALKDAIERALAFSKPHFFSDEEVDPKALDALKAAWMLATTPQASTSTT